MRCWQKQLLQPESRLDGICIRQSNKRSLAVNHQIKSTGLFDSVFLLFDVMSGYISVDSINFVGNRCKLY